MKLELNRSKEKSSKVKIKYSSKNKIGKKIFIYFFISFCAVSLI